METPASLTLVIRHHEAVNKQAAQSFSSVSIHYQLSCLVKINKYNYTTVPDIPDKTEDRQPQSASEKLVKLKNVSNVFLSISLAMKI